MEINSTDLRPETLENETDPGLTPSFDFASLERTSPLTPQDFINDIQPSIPIGTRQNRSSKTTADLLPAMLERERKLDELSRQEVVFSPPLVSWQGVHLIGPGTINVIQGRHGSHKSRLGESLAVLFLKKEGWTAHPLGFERNECQPVTVCYIDTERNLTEELPNAIQTIKIKAGYNLSESIPNFRYTSIKDVLRPDRLPASEAFVGHVRQQTTNHLMVFLDVVTDCVSSFNDDQQAMQLFDFIGNLCDRYNSTFVLIIHENPGSEKARGHTGTEAINKASTVMQIGFEGDSAGNEGELIRLRFLKLRRGKRPEPIYLQYSPEAKGLTLASSGAIAEHINNRKQKASQEDLIEKIESLLAEGPIAKGDLVKDLMKEFSASDKTIRDRLKDIEQQGPVLQDQHGRPMPYAVGWQCEGW
ncbi:hypothetical protein [Larkinella rosea]|uniref:AAA family ATPase n=1 Tax=Larkinella rosea TaxID=2025312 RepID=A0A3P1BM03_9BACT|nr:hypothetical protein [Larkinella rosea]RRB02059.1 hypothetical protein EHT25_16340 [Larkinella rosea]